MIFGSKMKGYNLLKIKRSNDSKDLGKLLAEVLGVEPSGRLIHELVKSKSLIEGDMIELFISDKIYRKKIQDIYTALTRGGYLIQ